ncbi:MAG: hypothetical protein QM780_09525 [Hyphomicrobium sp.]|uniref:cytochrome c3 family protein n=1 Tax=Hyphomicrobium sp. TaxID=82 RepID=UPI0039E24614
MLWPVANSSPGVWRDRIARLAAFTTLICVCVALLLTKGTQFLMPGPMTSAHSAIEKCSTCHTKNGTGKLSWVHGLVAGDPLADSKACLTCHKMPATAFNPHGASGDALKQSGSRLIKIAAQTPAPLSARAQDRVFPTRDIIKGGLYCATCHQEHQGVNFNLAKISNEQCRSCHEVKFDSFDGNHPAFDNYPFKRRTRIIYDHAGHFDKHFPEVAKKDAAKRIPATCSTCHDSSKDKRIMAVAPFEQTCSGCHLDQIKGKERASGPKGIAFLSLPGLDLQTLKSRKAAVGEWPDASEAELSPFMKVMISRTEPGHAVVRTLDGLNLQDLSKASDVQINAVKDLVWEIKRLFFALISGKATDVLADIKIGNGVKLSQMQVADLTASIPRDVIIGAQQQWLPHLAKEISGGPIASDANQGGSQSQATDAKPAAAAPERETEEERDSSEAKKKDEDTAPVKTVKRDPPACVVRVFGQCLLNNGPAEASQSEDDAGKDGAARDTNLPAAMQAGLGDLAQPGAREDVVAQVDGGGSQPKATNQSDDLLFPTEEELREMKTLTKGAAGGAATSDTAATSAPASAAAPTGIESGMEAEDWADDGGWYRQDYAIFYRPVGHKDKFIYSWLTLTGPSAPKGDRSPTAAVFDSLTGKDAQGSCTKCHSIDVSGRGRVVNFAPASAATKQGQFTTFIHEPHFGVMENRGCLTCHSLEKQQPYLMSYVQGNPLKFTSNFGVVKKDLCQSCHATNAVRQDCLTCHKYHVNGVVTPIMNTKIPMQ